MTRLTGVHARRRLAAALATVLLGVVLIVLAVALGSGGATSGPPVAAAKLVPADALAYLNVSTDPRRPEVGRALAVARRFPGYASLDAALGGRLAAITGTGAGQIALTRDVRPWLGREAALAILNTTSGSAGALILLQVSSRPAAQAFLTRSGATAAGSDRGVGLLRYPSGVEAAFVDSDFLALGQDASVRAAIDVATGAAPALAHDPDYRRAAAHEPEDRVLDAYVSQAGVRRVLEPRSGLAGAVGQLLDDPALDGVAFSVSPDAGGARVLVRSALDSSLARLSGAAQQLAPVLLTKLPAGASLVLDSSDLARLAPRVLRAGAAAGVAGQAQPLLARLASALAAEGINVGQLLSIFSGESALAIVPGSSATSPPAVVLVARTRDQASVSAALASLETPLSELFAAPTAGPGEAPEFNDRQVAGITDHQLSLAPGLELDYAVSNGLVVVSTSLGGIADVLGASHPVTDAPAFRATLGGRPQQITSLLFLDLSQLLSIGEQTGLTSSASFSTLQPDLSHIRAVGLSSTSNGAETTSELLLQIS